MKKLISIAMLLLTVYAQAQIGIGTTTPNSMLDVRGSLSLAITTFTTATTAGASDNTFLFTGTSAATLTLPTAVGITGRVYWIKNISSNGSTLTIATTSSQTIDGLTTWTLTQTNKVISLLSNGTNWYVRVESLPGNSTGTAWILGGNNVASLQNIGTTSNFHLPFVTNNTEKMRLTSTGSLGIGTSTFNGTYPERLIVDAGTPTTVNDYQNVIVGKGNTNNYAQLNIQNINAGTAASSDVVATADNGNETTNFVDMGINSSTSSSGIMGGINDSYLYNLGQNFLIGTGTAAKSLVFMTGGTAQATNERMRIDGNGNVGIGTTTPAAALHVVKSNAGGNVITVQNTSASGYSSADFLSNTGTLSGTFGYGNGSVGAPFTGRNYFNSYGNDFLLANGSNTPFLIQGSTNNVGINNTSPTEKLDVTGNVRFSGALMPNNSPGTAGYFLQSTGAGTAPVWFDANGFAWQLNGNTVGSEKTIGTNSGSNFALPFVTNGTERMRISNLGDVAIGTSTFTSLFPEQLLVIAASPTTITDYQNVIVGKGNTNNYAQLNIQNMYSAVGNSASSDVVATSDNGNESVNFIDMGINSGTNSSGGIYGGANTGYLYSIGNDFALGNATASKNLLLFTGGTATTNERLRITGTGLVGIGNITPTSTMEVAGSVGYAITTTASNITLDATNHTVIITGGTPTITLPAASGCTRRIYVIVNQTGTARTISSYLNFSAAGTTTVALNSSITVQSNGTSWYRIQ